MYVHREADLDLAFDRPQSETANKVPLQKGVSQDDRDRGHGDHGRIHAFWRSVLEKLNVLHALPGQPRLNQDLGVEIALQGPLRPGIEEHQAIKPRVPVGDRRKEGNGGQ